MTIPKNMIIVPKHEISLIRNSISAFTEEGVRESIGVSWNTWVKILKSQKIKLNTYERIKQSAGIANDDEQDVQIRASG